MELKPPNTLLTSLFIPLNSKLKTSTIANNMEALSSKMAGEKPMKPYPPYYYWGNTPEEEYYETKCIRSTASFFTSPRGLSLFTKSWLPGKTNYENPPKGLIFMVHGYCNDISWNFQATPIFLAQNGFACFALDLEGHGRSGGLKSYVPNLNLVVDDLIAFSDFTMSENPSFKNLPRFMHGESMGGGICLLMHFRVPELFNGAILSAPMCKVAEKLVPRWPIPEIGLYVSKFISTWPIIPIANKLQKGAKTPEKRLLSALNPARYNGKPRMGTVAEMFRAANYINGRLGDVKLPFLVLHGSNDIVCDPRGSRKLYEMGRNEDKSLKIYEGMVHSLLCGESDENAAIVRGDILNWLNLRCH